MPLLHRKPRARSGQVSSLQLDADDRIIDVIDVDHPFVRYRLHRVPTMALWYTLFIKVPTIEGIQTTLNAMGGPAVGVLVLTYDLCAEWSALCLLPRRLSAGNRAVELDDGRQDALPPTKDRWTD